MLLAAPNECFFPYINTACNGLKENEMILNDNIRVFIVNFSHNSTYKSFHFTELVA